MAGGMCKDCGKPKGSSAYGSYCKECGNSRQRARYAKIRQEEGYEVRHRDNPLDPNERRRQRVLQGANKAGSCDCCAEEAVLEAVKVGDPKDPDPLSGNEVALWCPNCRAVWGLLSAEALRRAVLLAAHLKAAQISRDDILPSLSERLGLDKKDSSLDS